MINFLTAILILLFSAHGSANSTAAGDKVSKALENYPNLELNINLNEEHSLQEPESNTPFPSHPPIKMSNNPGIKVPPEKINTYNVNSGKSVGLVSEKAVENAKPLIPLQDVPTTTPSPKPTITPSFIPPSPTPTPLIPSISPFPTPTCKYYLGRECPEIACIQDDISSVNSICGCPCVPPPIY